MAVFTSKLIFLLLVAVVILGLQASIRYVNNTAYVDKEGGGLSLPPLQSSRDRSDPIYLSKKKPRYVNNTAYVDKEGGGLSLPPLQSSRDRSDPIYLSKKKPRPRRAKNVLLLVAEDLRPQLGCYGTQTITPNIDKLASNGYRFKYAFNQAPICSPSRNSMLSGRRPDTTRVYQFESMLALQAPAWKNIFGFFRDSMDYHSYR